MIAAKVKIRMNEKWVVWIGESLDGISETVARFYFLFEIDTLEEIPLNVVCDLPNFGMASEALPLWRKYGGIKGVLVGRL